MFCRFHEPFGGMSESVRGSLKRSSYRLSYARVGLNCYFIGFTGVGQFCPIAHTCIYKHLYTHMYIICADYAGDMLLAFYFLHRVLACFIRVLFIVMALV